MIKIKVYRDDVGDPRWPSWRWCIVNQPEDRDWWWTGEELDSGRTGDQPSALLVGTRTLQYLRGPRRPQREAA